jgi:phage terminase large subunit-like protein
MSSGRRHVARRATAKSARPRRARKSASKPPKPSGFTDLHVLKALDYARRVVSGEIPANRLAVTACERQLRDLERSRADAAWPYEFNESLAGRACRFLEALPHVKGDLAGRKLELEGWQCFIVTTLFGWVKRGTTRRRFRRGTCFVPRGNGKSAISSGVGLYCTFAEGEGGAEGYSAATTKDQAKIVWDVARQMLNKAPHGPALRDRLGVEAPTAPTASSIYQVRTNSTFKPLSREADNLDGLNIHIGVIDEIHAHRTREIYDVVETGTGKRSNSLLWVISTAGSDTSGIGYEVYTYAKKLLTGVFEDDSTFAIVYEMDDGDDWTAELTWRKANPNWGISVQPEVIAQLCRKAQQVASAQNAFLTKHLDVWVNADQSWMSMAAWDRCADPALRIEDFAADPCFEGLDLASKVDLAAKTRVFVRELPHRTPERAARGHTETHYYGFLESYLPEAAVTDGRNSQYGGWVVEGKIITTPGDVLDFSVVKQGLLDDRDQLNVREVTFDPWQAQQLANELLDEAVPMVELRPTVQNFSEPMKSWEALVLDGRFHHDGNPLFRWMVSNVVCHRDAKDNIYPRKERPENKIDGPVAIIMALNRALAAEPEAGPYSGTRGFRTL